MEAGKNNLFFLDLLSGFVCASVSKRMDAFSLIFVFFPATEKSRQEDVGIFYKEKKELLCNWFYCAAAAETSCFK